MNRFRMLAALASLALASSCATTAPAAEAPYEEAEGLFEDDPIPTVQVEFALPNENDPNRVAYDSMAQAAGVPVVLDFFFNACPACNTNARNVRELAEEFHGTAAQVVEVSIDDDQDSYDSWIGRHGGRHPVLNGSDGDLVRLLGVRRYPTVVVLDENHEVVWRHVGVWTPAVKQRLRMLLQARQLAKR